jgi:hypothetical protein
LSSLRAKAKANKGQQPKATTRTRKNPEKTPTDHREQLCNGGQVGPIEQVSLPEAMITSLRGILLDLDPARFRPEQVPLDVLANPARFYELVISKMLARHPVLAKAEVRVSGRGLHVIIRFEDPVQFADEADRQRWAAIVKVVQRLLPTDPDCPGITALTRPLGSVNSKNGVTVERLHEGEPVSAEEVLGLFEQVRTSPFRTVARLLLGDERVTPYPVCRAAASRLNALDRVGMCYGTCGKVRLGQLYDVFLAPRSTRTEG